jgi:type IV pilus assembly protein PilY1
MGQDMSPTNQIGPSFAALKRWRWLVLVVAFLLPGVTHADIVNFGKGSLIIPNQASFQTPCGSLAGYGLVLRILKANQPGGYFNPTTPNPARTPVTVYWAVGSNKHSPNRCVPTDLNTTPDGKPWNTGLGSSPSWNDGCDFQVANSGDQPVTVVDYSIDPWTQGAQNGLFPKVQVPMRTPGVISTDSTRVPPALTTQYIALKGSDSTLNSKGASTTVGTITVTSATDGTTTGLGTSVTYNAPDTITASGTFVYTKKNLTSTPITAVTITLKDGSGNVLGTTTLNPPFAIGTNVTLNWSTSFDINSNSYTGNKPSGTYISVKDTTLSNIKYVGNGTPEAVPVLPAKTLTAAKGWTTIQYLGAPFIIDGSQAQEVIEFIENGDPNNSDPKLATDVAIQSGNPGAPTLHILNEFTYNNASYNSLMARSGGYFDQCTGPKMLINGERPGSLAATTDHYVTMHQSLTSFNANVARRISDVPPKIALVDTESNGDNTGSASVSGLLILDAYLANAGLYVSNSSKNVDSAGCPPNTKSGCNINGGKPGFIYDQFDADADLVSFPGYAGGILNQVGSDGKLIYGVLWTPHWEATSNSQKYSFAPPYDASSGSGKAGLDNIATFLGKYGTGLMGECASIASYESSPNGATKLTALDTPNTNLLFTGPVANNHLSKNEGSWEGMNCSDPDYPNNVTDACTATGASSCKSNDTSGGKQECVYWDNATNEFAQVGDFHFVQTSGAVDDFKPDDTLNSTYGPGSLRIATTWTNYHPGDYPNGGSCTVTKTDGTCDNRWDIFDLGRKGGDASKGQIVYVAGHDYQISTVGSRIILNTLLNLGSDAVLDQRSLSAPTIYADPNGARDSQGATALGPVPLNFTGIYDVVTGVPASRFQYTWGSGSQWLFPRTPGNIYEAPLVQAVGGVQALQAGNTLFASSVLWDAQGPGDLGNPSGLTGIYGGKASQRNLFTYFGGQVRSVTGAPNGLLQQGWTPSIVAPEEVDDSHCTDVLSYGEVVDGKHAPYFGFVSGADGVCDIEEATGLVPVSAGNDFGLSEWSVPVSGNLALLMSTTNKDVVKGLLQVVEGYCFTTDSHHDGSGDYSRPSKIADCNAPTNPVNNPVMGGILHSTPAVVPPSANVSDHGVSRPTIMLAAGADGQLHAFYISGGNGYQGPLNPLHYPNTAASTVFGQNGLGTDWMSGSIFTPPLPMTELWSYLPASQLPLLASNTQMVDSAPVVQDVFVDFGNTGSREWHTVVVATAGGPLGNPGAEIFALDITNPLQPVLLWDLMGAWTGPASSINPDILANNSTVGANAPMTVQTGNRGGFAQAGTTMTGVYDYSMLGASYGLSLGVLRAGDQPTFPVYVATNMNKDSANSAQNGVQLYSIDIATGQKIWQWVEPYPDAPNNSPGDPVPPAASLLTDENNSLGWVYVPDYEGNLWELSARFGTNPWNGKGVSAKGEIFSTTTLNEPLSSPVAIADLPGSMAGTAGLKSWAGRTIALVGTDNSGDSFVDTTGELHTINIDSRSRPTTGIAPSDPAAPFPFSFTNQRVVGNLSVAGTSVYVNTASLPVTDPLTVDTSSTGKTFAIDLASAQAGDLGSNLTAVQFLSGHPIYGGVAVYHDPTNSKNDRVVGAQVAQLAILSSISTAATPNSALSIDHPSNDVLYRILGWMRRFLS